MRILFLIFITLLGLFFYSFRLKETYIFIDDTARDTLKALQIWQDKEITLIGPPASFSLNTIREFYFGSIYLYIGILGLIISNWSPLGAVLPNTILFTLSIPLFYKFISSQAKDKYKIIFVSLIYVLSPITVIHSRFFWNPNLIIPLSVVFWYLIMQKIEKNKRGFFYSLLAGLIGGVMFNLHYISVLPIFSFLLVIFFQKEKLKSLLATVGFIIACSPLFLFELRNNFYLSNSLWFNLFNQQSDLYTNQVSLLQRGGYLLNIFESILGLRQAELNFPTLFNNSLIVFLMVIVFLLLMIIKEKKSYFQGIRELGFKFFLPLALSLFVTVYSSFDKGLLIRYMFPVYPLLVLLISTFLYSSKFKLLSFVIFIPIIYSSVGILFDDARLGRSYIPLAEIEQICQKIVQDSPEGRYNITENIRGDARAMAFRYCLNKNSKNKPQDELTYTDLSTLYVVSPSLEKIYIEKRWEFTASSPWKLINSEKIDSTYLYKFIKDSNDKN